MNIDDVIREASSRVVAVGQRFTGGRRTIVRALIGARRPLSIPEILASTPELAQSSVYRNLALLEKAGVVSRVITTDEWARFELSEDITGHHHHMVCTMCGSVDDVRVPDDIEVELDKVLCRVAEGAGFTMEHHRLDLVGVCRTCR